MKLIHRPGEPYVGRDRFCRPPETEQLERLRSLLMSGHGSATHNCSYRCVGMASSRAKTASIGYIASSGLAAHKRHSATADRRGGTDPVEGKTPMRTGRWIPDMIDESPGAGWRR